MHTGKIHLSIIGFTKYSCADIYFCWTHLLLKQFSLKIIKKIIYTRNPYLMENATDKVSSKFYQYVVEQDAICLTGFSIDQGLLS